jgi:hypothetical protein
MTTFFFRPRATSKVEDDDALNNFVPRGGVLSGIGRDENAVLNADARLPRCCSHHLATNSALLVLFIVVVVVVLAFRLPLLSENTNASSTVFVVQVDLDAIKVSRLVVDRKTPSFWAPPPRFILLLEVVVVKVVVASSFRSCPLSKHQENKVVSSRPIEDRCHMHQWNRTLYICDFFLCRLVEEKRSSSSSSSSLDSSGGFKHRRL